jgi:hypothetical protein
VDQWDNTDSWWKKFKKGVDDGQANPMTINGGFAIVIGLLGLDTYTGPGHEGKHGTTELHPVYAMFVRTELNHRSRTHKWAFFVRNLGNEGYCGANDMKLPSPGDGRGHRVIKVQISDAARVSARNAWNGARGDASTAELREMTMIEQPNDRGMELTFILLVPEKQSWIVGDITFEEPIHIEPQFEAVRAQIEKLSEDSRKELREQQRSAVFRREETTPQLSVKTIAEPAAVGVTYLESPRKVKPKGDLVQPGEDSIGEMNRRKQLEVFRNYLAEKRLQVELPPEK